MLTVNKIVFKGRDQEGFGFQARGVTPEPNTPGKWEGFRGYQGEGEMGQGSGIRERGKPPCSGQDFIIFSISNVFFW